MVEHLLGTYKALELSFGYRKGKQAQNSRENFSPGSTLGQSIDHMPHLVCCYGNKVGMTLQRGTEVLGKKRPGWVQQRGSRLAVRICLSAFKPQIQLVGGCSGNVDGARLPSTSACQSQSRKAFCPFSTPEHVIIITSVKSSRFLGIINYALLSVCFF